MRNKWLNGLVKGLLVVGLLAGLFVSYQLLSEMGAQVDALSMELHATHVLTFFAVGLGILFVIGAIVICVTLFVMMCSIDKDPFVRRNVRALRLMGFVALGMAACCLLLVLLPANTILAQFVGAAVALCGLFSLVLSGVFERAVAFKEENDLTV